MANRLVTITSKNAARYGDREAYRFCWRKEGEWQSTSWKEFDTQIKVAARAFVRLGLIEKDTIAICSPNTPQILISELGAFANRLTSIPIYSSSSQEQFDFIVTNGGAKLLFVGDSNQYTLAYSYWKRNPSAISKIIVFKNNGIELNPDDTATIFWDDFVRLGMEADEEVKKEVARRTENGLPEDMATLIYTSGTTGEPKGVCITHSNYDAAMSAHLDALTNVSDKDLSMAFLPMSHILEKAWCYFCITKGIAIAVNYDPRVIQETIHDIHPNIMCCVPRFWEKVYAAVKEKISAMTPIQRMFVGRAIKVGRRRNLEFVRVGRKVPWMLEKEYSIWNKKIFQKLKEAIGVPNPNMFPTAGAAISDKIVEFFRSVGIEVTVGYGLSETTATVSFFPQTGYEIGSVGKVLPGVVVRIAEDGEILVKGATVTPGYFNNPKANEEAFTSDGFFRTGDAGYLTPDGSLVLTDRIKDLFKTSNGKYVAPQMIESRLAENKYIDDVTVIGDRRKFVTALIVPNMPQLCKWAREKGIDFSDPASLINDPRSTEFIMSQIEPVQEGLARHEKIKRITLLPRPFSLEKGELTNTLKVRRKVVAEHFAREIEEMYSH